MSLFNKKRKIDSKVTTNVRIRILLADAVRMYVKAHIYC